MNVHDIIEMEFKVKPNMRKFGKPKSSKSVTFLPPLNWDENGEPRVIESSSSKKRGGLFEAKRNMKSNNNRIRKHLATIPADNLVLEYQNAVIPAYEEEQENQLGKTFLGIF